MGFSALVIGAGAAGTAGAAAILGAGASAFATAALGAVIAGGIIYAGSAIFGIGPETPKIDLASLGRGMLVNSVGNSEHIPVIYGERRIAGTRVFSQVSGTDNRYLYMIFALCEGEVDSLGTVLGNQDDIESGDFAAYTQITRYTGTDAQAADANFVAAITEWTTDHKLSGTAYLAVRLEWEKNPEANPWTTFPNITCDVRGRKIYDMRVPAHDPDDASTWAWSANPALCILDYLRNDRFGKGIPLSAIDTASFETAADYCDQLVTVPDDLGDSPSGTTTQTRYTLNGAVLTSDTIINNLDRMLSSCRGMLVWSAGQYKLVLDRVTTTHDPLHRPGEAFFNENNIIGSWKIQLGDRASRWNRIRAQFFNPDRSWESDTAIIESSSFLASDNNEVLETQIELPFTSNKYMARQLAGITLKESRDRIVAEFTASIEAIEAEVGDVVKVTHTTPGWTDKLFRIIGMEVAGEDEIKVTVVEYNASVYSLDTLTELAPVPATSLPNPGVVQPPSNLVLTTGASVALVLADGTVQARILVSWTGSTDYFVDHYEVRWKIASESEWASIKIGAASTEYMIPMVKANVAYDVNVRAINYIGKASTWLTGSSTAAGKSLAPGDPSGLVATGMMGAVQLVWTNPSDADLNLIEIYASTANDRTLAALVGQVRGNSFVHVLTPTSTRWYWVRAVDTSGNTSGWFPAGATAGVSGTALQVTGIDILNGIITNEKLAALAVEADNLANGSINLGSGVVIGELPDTKLAAGAVTAGKIAANAVNAVNIAADQVQASHMAANSITAGNGAIANLAVVGAKIAAAAIGTGHIQNAAITNAKIGTAAVTNAKIGTAAVDTLKIAGNAVTIPVTAESSVLFVGAPRTWTSILSVSINALGSDVYGWLQFEVSFFEDSSESGFANAYFRIRCSDGTYLPDGSTGISWWGAGIKTGTFVHSPSTGSKTYYLEIITDDEIGCNFDYRNMIIMGVRR